MIESGAAIQELDGACRRRVGSEGSLPPIGWVAPEPSGAGEAAREGAIMSAWTWVVGEGQGV